MKEKNIDNERRYFITLAIKNILEKDRLDFTLHRPDMDQEEITEIAESNGFNPNHPDFNGIAQQVKQSFTLSEMSEILRFVATLEVLEVNIEIATYQAQVPTQPREGYKAVVVSLNTKDFDFSSLDGYSLPYVIHGRYTSLRNP